MVWCVIGILANIVLIGLDQLTKYFAEVYLQPIRSVPLIPNVFELYFLTNEGAAFGIMQGGRWLFIILTALILGGVYYFYMKLPKSRHELGYRISLILISSGALGNFIDRIHQGFVVDFFYFKLIDFPVFNVADMYVVIGTILLMIMVLFFSADGDDASDGEIEFDQVKG